MSELFCAEMLPGHLDEWIEEADAALFDVHPIVSVHYNTDIQSKVYVGVFSFKLQMSCDELVFSIGDIRETITLDPDEYSLNSSVNREFSRFMSQEMSKMIIIHGEVTDLSVNLIVIGKNEYHTGEPYMTEMYNDKNSLHEQCAIILESMQYFDQQLLEEMCIYKELQARPMNNIRYINTEDLVRYVCTVNDYWQTTVDERLTCGEKLFEIHDFCERLF
jgi:hypothetical protein